VNVWDPERVVDAGTARRMLRDQFPDLELTSVEPLGVGWDVTVYLVDETWAVRFPRREVAAPTLLREIALLPALAPRLPIPVPVPQLVGRPTDDYPWTFWGAPFLRGDELADSGLPDADRGGLATQLGHFLRTLHDPALAAELSTGPASVLSQDPMRRATPSTRGPMAREFLDLLASRGTWDAGSAVDRAADELIAAADPLPPPTGDPVLVHGDLHLRHVLVGADGSAAGVIDWGDACYADPALDLSLAYAAFHGPARAAFFEAYGARPDRERELRARVLALCLCAALADYADQHGMSALLAESLRGVARAAGR
jgi:aminoglycoside phosphotransferase (APT) family kinase protein